MSPIWKAGRGPIGFLPALLFRDRRPALAILVAWILAFAGSSLLGFIITRISPNGAGVTLGNVSGALVLIAVAVLSPLIETLAMGGALELLRRWLRPWQAVIVSAVGWGVAHSLAAPFWGLVIWWPFLIFSTIFLTWRVRGFWTAFGVAAAVHVLQNVAPAVAIVLGY